jgi:iduronate 2-sulfatase
MPAIAYASYELQNFPDVAATGFKGGVNETLVDWKAREEVRGYQAGVSYTDHNIGVVLKELKRLGQWDNTIIMFWGDHGWKLGQHGAWAKHTNFHCDTNTPVMLRVPGLTDGGMRSHALVEHVDIMATLLDAAGLDPLPTCPHEKPWLTSHCTEGRSFLQLTSNPNTAWKNASYSQYPRGGDKDPYMGYSMNTDKNLRFTAWVDFDQTSNKTSFTMKGKECGFELYDHTTDPDENYNLAYRSKYRERVQDLFAKLKAGWRATMTTLPSAPAVSRDTIVI